MHRWIPCLLVCLLLPGFALAGETKTWKNHDLRWSLPDDWEFVDVSGTLAAASCTEASIQAYAIVGPSGGLPLDERLEEIRRDAKGLLTKMDNYKTIETTLGGVSAKAVVMEGRGSTGAKGHFRYYAMESDGKFYHLLIRAWHGAHHENAEAINALRKGFQLIDGGDDKHKPEKMDEFGGPEPEEEWDPDAPEEEEEDKGEEAGGLGGNWPPGGPQRDGRTIKFPSHNLEWAVPEGTPFTVDAVAREEKAATTLLVRFEADIERKKQEFEQDSIDANRVVVTVMVEPAPPGRDSVEVVKGTRLQKRFRKELFSDVQGQHTRTFEGVKLGNRKWAHIVMAGTGKGGGKQSFLWFETILRGELYIAQVMLRGHPSHKDRLNQTKKPLFKLLKGMKFLNTEDHVPGPLVVDEVGTFTWKRGKKLGKEAEIIGPGLVFKKPKDLAQLRPNTNMNKNIRMAFEGRTKDGKQYIYFDVQTWRMRDLHQTETKLESLIEKRAQTWRSSAGENAKVAKKEKAPPFKKGSFGAGKGFQYHFTGDLRGTPFVEDGWVVKHKGLAFWLRVQYGGEGAEKSLKPLFKKIKRGVKFKK